jgi:hypothetical protein
MKKLLIAGFLLFPFLLLLAQEQVPYKYTDRNAEPSETRLTNFSGSPSVIARISFIAPMFVLEFAPVEHFVFSSSFRIWPTFWVKNSQGDRIYQPSFNPRISLEPRYFFTQHYRKSKGRRSDYYSGWYVGIPFVMTFPELDFSMGTVMGFQSTFGKRWYWNVGMGPGVSYQDISFKMILSGTAAFGVILN